MDEVAGRARAMARSIADAARASGCPPDAVERLTIANAVAMEPRLATLDDDHHPAYLHPGRSVLILLRDVGSVPEEGLVLAALFESMDDGLRAPADRVSSACGPHVAEARDGLPVPGDERLLERLVGLAEPAALAVVAERIDQLRHLHLRPELRSRWDGDHAEVVDVWLPFAQRLHDRLGSRIAHWERTFRRRL